MLVNFSVLIGGACEICNYFFGARKLENIRQIYIQMHYFQNNKGLITSLYNADYYLAIQYSIKFCLATINFCSLLFKFQIHPP